MTRSIGAGAEGGAIGVGAEATGAGGGIIGFAGTATGAGFLISKWGSSWSSSIGNTPALLSAPASGVAFGWMTPGTLAGGGGVGRGD